jgi:trigger factor
MNVVLSNAEVGPWRRELKIVVPAEEVETETRKVVDDFRRRVRLPGFRKGKVPPRLVEQRFKEDIEREVVDRLVPRYWRLAREEAALDPLLAPRVSDVETAAGAPLSFTATVEVRPGVELDDLGGFELPEVDVEPTGEEVESTLEDLRRARAIWHPVERPAAHGDLVEGHLTDLGAGEGPEEPAAGAPPAATPGGAPRPVRFEVGHPKVWEELTAAATGRAVGEVVEFTRRQEGDPEAAPERRLRLLVDAVKEPELPPLDDDFARQSGRFADLAALRRDLEERLREGKREEARRRRREALLEQLCRRHPLELPQWVVDAEIEDLLGDYAGEMSRQGIDVERSRIDWDRLAADLRPQAERRVHARLLLDAVAKAEGIEVGEAELEATLAVLARARGRSTPALRRELAEAGKLEGVRAQLRRDHAVKRLTGEAPAEAGA